MTRLVFAPALAMGLAIVAAQPVAAIQMVQLAPVANAASPEACPAGPDNCRPQRATPPATIEPELGSGPIVAGIGGLLVLGLVFGRRKAGLREVVS